MSWILYDIARGIGLGGCGAFLLAFCVGGRRR